MAPIFEWNKLFDTGLKETDRQHQHLLNPINSFGETLANNRLNEADVVNIYHELVDYARYHFEEEERLMVRFHVDSRHVEQHTRMYQSFIAEVGHLYQNYHYNQQEGGSGLFHFLLNWLAYHIMGTDMSMARQLQAIDSGTCPQAAFEEEGRHGAEMLHKHIASLLIPAGEGFWQGSVSIGVAVRQTEMKSIDDLIKAADRSLYAAKAAGRNCVRIKCGTFPSYTEQTGHI